MTCIEAMSSHFNQKNRYGNKTKEYITKCTYFGVFVSDESLTAALRP